MIKNNSYVVENQSEEPINDELFVKHDLLYKDLDEAFHHFQNACCDYVLTLTDPNVADCVEYHLKDVLLFAKQLQDIIHNSHFLNSQD